MDIEGAELEILHQAKLPKRIRCLVFEYSYSVDARMNQFKTVIRRLRGFFEKVEFPPGALKRPKDEHGVECNTATGTSSFTVGGESDASGK